MMIRLFFTIVWVEILNNFFIYRGAVIPDGGMRSLDERFSLFFRRESEDYNNKVACVDKHVFVVHRLPRHEDPRTVYAFYTVLVTNTQDRTLIIIY